MTEQTWWWRERWEGFRRGSKPISIAWEGGQAQAVLFDEGVPETAGAVSRVLPLEVPVVHVAWSGEMVMSADVYDLGAPRENTVRLPRPGDLTWDPDAGELAFAYGTAECRLPSGENTVVVYGSVVQGMDAFAEFCWRRRFEGVATLTLSARSE
jgi:Protein of unknown function (DUF3830)